MSPTQAVYRACVDVRFGNNQDLMNGIGGSWTITEYIDATELHDMWVSSNRPWPENKDGCDLSTKATRAFLEGQHLSWANYFWTIEHDLNACVYYLACALNWVLNENFVNCDCTGEVGNDGLMEYYTQAEADWVANEEGVWEAGWLVKYQLANIMSMFGLVMALIAVSVVKRLDLLIYV